MAIIEHVVGSAGCRDCCTRHSWHLAITYYDKPRLVSTILCFKWLAG